MLQAAGLGLECFQNVDHIVAVVDAVQVEEERVEFGTELSAADLVPAERLALVIQIAGQRSHVVGSVNEFQDSRGDEMKMRFEHCGCGNGELLPNEQVQMDIANLLSTHIVEDQGTLRRD